ncbi:MAG: NepR family anti-sigma factor [Sphingomicrobium sp.]
MKAASCEWKPAEYEARYPREGDERLSEKQDSESQEAGGNSPSANGATGKRSRRKPAADVGRALRSVYDDTVREAVPDDFMDLLGKLN